MVEQLEQYFEQKLIQNVAFNRDNINKLFPESNLDKSYLEVCNIKKILDTAEDAMNVLKLSAIRGQSFENIINVAEMFLSLICIDDSQYELILKECKYIIEKAFINKLLSDANIKEAIDNNYFIHDTNFDIDTLNDEQRKIYNIISNDISQKKQIITAIIGSAGVGKSYFIKEIEYCASVNIVRYMKLRPTGVAAYNIKARTIHNFFKLDNNVKSYLEKGTSQAEAVIATELIIIDEFSILEKSVLEKIHELC